MKKMKYGVAKTDRMVYYGFGGSVGFFTIYLSYKWFINRERRPKFSDDNFTSFTNTEA